MDEEKKRGGKNKIKKRKKWVCRICRTEGCSGPEDHRLVLPNGGL